MFRGDNDASPVGDGEFLLQLLKNPPKHKLPNPIGDHPSLGLTHDPAVAAVGPPTTFAPQWPSNGGNFSPAVNSWPHSLFPTPPSPFFNLPKDVPWCFPEGCPPDHRLSREDGCIESEVSRMVIRDDSVNPNLSKLMFGSFQCETGDSFYGDSISREGGKCSVSGIEERGTGGTIGRFDGRVDEFEKKEDQFGCRNRVADDIDGLRRCQCGFDCNFICKVDFSSKLKENGRRWFREETHTQRDMDHHEQFDGCHALSHVKGLDDTAGKTATMKFNDAHIKDVREKVVFTDNTKKLQDQIGCSSHMERLSSIFNKIYESLIPTNEEKVKQKILLKLLGKVVCREWPKALLHLYGSCANSFDVLKSDVDVCLEMDEDNYIKSEILLKLADILQSENLQNVQALTRARVPVVKFFDPVTGISCDICLNNVLAVVNTKLLRDYARIDGRLRQLVFIVKYWAKCRRVNETYKGSLSSYAYVLMCIHLLQRRRPAILPCLQRMEPTYSVKVNNVKCEYFDKVEKLEGFGSRNRESIAELVIAFFNYWAFSHDYANSVISVRTGTIVSKRDKKWTTRVGNDRHLICIEDPFEVTHDLGRVVDKFSINPLRKEFVRAADILLRHPYPPHALFQPLQP